jgi:transposase
MSQYKTNTINRNGHPAPQPLNPEVEVRAKRRRFSEAEKRRILQEADGSSEPGQVGALMRREGIYASYLSDWRREREKRQRSGLGKRPHSRQQEERATEVARLRQENERLKAQVVQAELIIMAQKKLAQVLEQTLTLNKDVGS